MQLDFRMLLPIADLAVTAPAARSRPRAPFILPERGIHFGTAVGHRALWATASALDSHRSDDSGSKVGRWPTFGGVTVPKWIRLSAHMRARSSRAYCRLWAVVGGGFFFTGVNGDDNGGARGVGLVMEYRPLVPRFGAEPGSRFRDSCDGSGPLEALWDRSQGRRVGPRFAARSDIHGFCGGHTASSAPGTCGPLRS